MLNLHRYRKGLHLRRSLKGLKSPSVSKGFKSPSVSRVFTSPSVPNGFKSPSVSKGFTSPSVSEGFFNLRRYRNCYTLRRPLTGWNLRRYRKTINHEAWGQGSSQCAIPNQGSVQYVLAKSRWNARRECVCDMRHCWTDERGARHKSGAERYERRKWSDGALFHAVSLDSCVTLLTTASKNSPSPTL